MSNDRNFRCPVCRARQPLQETCRRCKADLRLVVRARRRVDYLHSKRLKAQAQGDRECEQKLAAELRWLAPKPSGSLGE